MRHFRTILWYEVRMLLLSPSTYIAAVAFLLIMGLIFTKILDDATKEAQNVSPAIVFFHSFFLPVWVMVPLLTMKSIAEERRAGTLETLLATPVRTAEVVLAKYAASYLLYLLIWISTLGFMFVLQHFAQDPRLLDRGPLLGGYVFIVASGLLYVAIGTLASAVSRSQAVAAVIAVVGLVVLTLGPWAASEMTVLQQGSLHTARDALGAIDMFRHLGDFTQGVIDTRQIIFYLTGTTLALILSLLAVEAKILRS
jgi:ABC-2 type transport system permease protein